MKTCTSCGVSIADDAAFCTACGKSAVAVAAPAQPAHAVTVDAQQAMHQAAAQAQTAVAHLGPDKTISLVGGILGVLGAVLPFYVVSADALDQTSGGSLSLFHSGGTGVAIFVLAIALGGLPFVMTPSKSTNLIAFGAACAAIGILIGFRTFSYMGETIQADYGTGLYAGVLGFLVLAYGYGRKVIR